jgi:FkbM family methyltransferase
VRDDYIKRFTRRLRGRWQTKSLGGHAIAIVAETKNGRLGVHAGDFNVSRCLLENGEYDWAQISWLKQLLHASSHMVFAGAHVGALLIPLARISGTRSIVAFEPSPRNFRLLNMNLALNEIEGVVTMNTALGSRAGQIQFTENSINTGNSRIAPAKGEITVSLDTLDRTIPAHWASIDLIVMDTEGSEVAVMRGAQASLARTKNLYVEFSPEQLREQGSSAVDFVETVEKYFKSAYVFGAPIQFLGPRTFAAHLRGLQRQRGLLLDVLFTQDFAANPQLMNPPRDF